MTGLPDLQLPALRLAPALLGVRLVREDGRGRRRVGVIVETEAYPGGRDRASHTSGGRRTARTESMYLRGGHAYVYRIYGMHDCLNVVSGPAESGEAVLIRAVRPIEGLEAMRACRPGVRDRDLARGPGRLCRAFEIDRAFDRARFGEGDLHLEAGERVSRRSIVRVPRVGIDGAGVWAGRPWRFLCGERRWWSVPPRAADSKDLGSPSGPSARKGSSGTCSGGTIET